MMITEIQSFDEFIKMKEEELVLLGYFSTDACNVCKVLKPKVEELLQTEFPKMKMAYIRSDVLPDVAAQHQVFAAPTILVFFEGREYIRKSRNIGVGELQREIERPYSMIFLE
ncbi:MAG TPA: thioredoxin family protein [Draconibacterium sp.]|nr:thioredoxin family protein [Draconibacterium sp.]